MDPWPPSCRPFAAAILATVIATASTTTSQASLEDPYATELRPLIAEYCRRCHGGRRPKSDVFLMRAKSSADVRADPETWLDVRDALSQHSMPPPDRRQPTAEQRQLLVAGLDRILQRDGPTPATTDVTPGRPTLRRLTQREFDRTIKDLLGIVFDSGSRFPAAATVDGFDGNGDVQFVTPSLLETYVDVVTAIVDAWFAQPRRTPALAPPLGLDSMDRFDIEALGREFLPNLMRRAFRRPPQPTEVDRRAELLVAEWTRTGDPRAALHAAVRSVLLSPHFLFLVERGATQRARPLTGDELATRLSYFLWSTMPDAELFRAADTGQLTDPKGLEQQVARMLGSPRARALAENFAVRWLGIDRVLSLSKDVRKFRFDGELRRSMHREGIEFFDWLRRENRPVLDLIESPWGMLNARLAKHYGVQGVEGRALRPVRWPDRKRSGVLGLASVLAVTSYPLRTSPVQRGKWILETLLDAPPPPPPADAGELPKDDRQKDGLSLRQRLERHRSDARCANCHARMDPFGLALENFDAIGAWREQALGQPLDTAVTLPDGQHVDGPIELRDALVARREQILSTVIRRLGGYATGRRWTRREAPLVRSIRAATDSEPPRMHELVQAIVASPAFRYRGPIPPAKPSKQ